MIEIEAREQFRNNIRIGIKKEEKKTGSKIKYNKIVQIFFTTFLFDISFSLSFFHYVPPF